MFHGAILVNGMMEKLKRVPLIRSATCIKRYDQHGGFKIDEVGRTALCSSRFAGFSDPARSKWHRSRTFSFEATAVR